MNSLSVRIHEDSCGSCHPARRDKRTDESILLTFSYSVEASKSGFRFAPQLTGYRDLNDFGPLPYHLLAIDGPLLECAGICLYQDRFSDEMILVGTARMNKRRNRIVGRKETLAV